MDELGFIFSYGRGIAADVGRGLRFLEAGAAHGDIDAYNNLGLYYLEGVGGARDANKALSYFTKAADAGLPYAATNLGCMYRDGIGMAADPITAAKWFELGAERGDYWGALDRAILARDGSADKADLLTATKYFALAVGFNNVRAEDFDRDRQAEHALSKIPDETKRRVATELRRLPNIGVKRPRAESIDQELIRLERMAWKTRHPRYDLL
jgi:TPR repeat protein